MFITVYVIVRKVIFMKVILSIFVVIACFWSAVLCIAGVIGACVIIGDSVGFAIFMLIVALAAALLFFILIKYFKKIWKKREDTAVVAKTDQSDDRIVYMRTAPKGITAEQTDTSSDYFGEIEFPDEVLKSMKNNYRVEGIYTSLYQIKESYQLMLQTSSIETFCSRYDFAMQRCMNLKQAEACGLYKGQPSAADCMHLIMDSKHDLIIKCYIRYYSKAKAELATEKGVQNRLNKFWVTAAKYLDEFEIQDLKDELQNLQIITANDIT